jgi:Flp pilus assembly protein TadB
MSRLRWTLVALLVTATALFTVGVIGERSQADTHPEPARTHAEAAEPESAHEAGEAHGRTDDAETGSEGTDETLFGIDLESTPLLILAVIAGLALAGLVTTQLGRRRGVLTAIALAALAWAVLDAREALHQLDESRTDIAAVALVVGALHLAAAGVARRA